jgi:hypothetical protein
VNALVTLIFDLSPASAPGRPPLAAGWAGVACLIGFGATGVGAAVASILCAAVAGSVVSIMANYTGHFPWNDENIVYYWHFWYTWGDFWGYHYRIPHWHYEGADAW